MRPNADQPALVATPRAMDPLAIAVRVSAAAGLATVRSVTSTASSTSTGAR